MLVAAATVQAQHPAFRIKGRVITDAGAPIAGATVRLEAVFGYAAGTFAGQRLFDTTTNGKGEWNVGALQPGIWIFEVGAPGYLPEAVALPIRLLTTVSQGTANNTLLWDLVLKPLKTPDDPWGEFITEVAALAAAGKADDVRSALQRIPGDPGAERRTACQQREEDPRPGTHTELIGSGLA